MNGFIEINGKFYKEHSMVMLPTNKASELYLNSHIGLQKTNKMISVLPDFVNQFVYFLSDEPIKEGDWILITSLNGLSQNIRQCIRIEDNYFIINGNTAVFKDICKRVIASNDPELKIEKDLAMGGYSQISLLPRPSNSFLEALVREYNKGNRFDKVLIEYEENYGVSSLGGHADLKYRRLNTYKLRVAPDNTITIKPVQEEESYVKKLEDCIKNFLGFTDTASRRRIYRCPFLDETIIEAKKLI